jgi:lysozyme
MNARIIASALALSAAGLIGIAQHEGYRDKAYTPVKGDVPTVGFGETVGVKAGDKTEPVRALIRLGESVSSAEQAVKKCAPVPMHQREFDAFVSLTYNIGSSAFCKSLVAKRLNAGDYAGACMAILNWDMFQGKRLTGLTKRRQQEFNQCQGSPQ